MREDDIRRQVRKQRQFYGQALELGTFNVVLILVWILFDTGHSFWPKYVIFFSLLHLAFKSYQFGLFPMFSDKFQRACSKLHFMSEEWEQKKVDELTGKKSPIQKKAAATKPKSKPAAKTPTGKKPTQKKVVGRTTKST
jgi:hypothetical protein